MYSLLRNVFFYIFLAICSPWLYKKKFRSIYIFSYQLAIAVCSNVKNKLFQYIYIVLVRFTCASCRVI